MALNDIPMSTLVSSRRIEINDLPNELLTKILDMIDTKSQLNAEQVCQRWHRISDTIFANRRALYVTNQLSHRSAIKYVNNRCVLDISDYDLEIIPNVTKRLMNLESVGVSLIATERTLDVYDSNRYFLTAIISLFQYCVCDLKHISLILNETELFRIKNDDNLKLESNELLSVCKKFPNLNTFRLSSSNVLLDDHVIVDNWRELEVLYINTIRRGISVRPEFFEKISANIKQLELPSFMFEDRALNYLVDRKQCFDNLKVLRTVVVNESNSDAIKLIGHRFPSLETIGFEINSVSDVISFTLMDSVSKLTNLKVLSLHIYVDDQYFDFKSFRCLKHCKTIETLAIELEEDPPHDIMEAIAEYMPQIQTLSIQFDRIGEGIDNSCNCLLPITRMKQLKRLEIFNENCRFSYDCFRHIIDYLNAQKLECVHIDVTVKIADNKTLAEATLLLQSNNLYDDIIGVNDDEDVYIITLKRCNNPPECVVSMHLNWQYN